MRKNVSKIENMKLTIGIVVLLLLVAGLGFLLRSQAMVSTVLMDGIRGQLEDENKTQPIVLYDKAMAYALYASAAVKIDELDRAKSAIDWLIRNPADSRKTGWGVTAPWDAFADGSINPVSTVYGITVAFVVNALFDVYDATGDFGYLNIAEKALGEYIDYFQKTTTGGYFWYSDQESDNIDVPNVSAMLMAQYARAARYLNKPIFMEIAKSAHSHLLANKSVAKDGWYWGYMVDRPAEVNDLVHHLVIAKGMMDYALYTGDAYGVREVLNYIDFFQDGEIIYQFPRHGGISEKLPAGSARAYGIGMLIYISSRVNDRTTATRALEKLKKYRTVEGIYTLFPGEKIPGSPDVQAYVLYGIAEYKSLYGNIYGWHRFFADN